MKTLVSVPHHAYPSTVRDSAEAKLQQLAKYFDRIESVRAVLERERGSHRVEIVIKVGHGATLVVDSKAETIDLALEDALQRAKGLLTRHKERLVKRHRRAKREED
ncbi:MAG TPA: HPF/RaiA family ribosome-associated protein [Planctomycetota bacterium]|nr:HPF/RaiA family ribosome-associated protein [Planctomycetota bacterium]